MVVGTREGQLRIMFSLGLFVNEQAFIVFKNKRNRERVSVLFYSQVFSIRNNFYIALLVGS